MLQVDWILRDDYCEPMRGMQVAVEMWGAVNDLDAMIGPGCSVVCQPLALLAAAWKIPIISWGASSPDLSDKNIYPTFFRLEAPFSARAPVFDSIADMFGWKKIGILVTIMDVYRLTAIAVKEEMERQGKEVFMSVVDTTMRGSDVDPASLSELRAVLATMKKQVRIFIMMALPPDFRNMLIMAMDEGMLNGEYVFMCNEFSVEIVEQKYRPDVDPIIYKGILAIGVSRPSGREWDEYRQDVIDAFQDPRFDGFPHLSADADIDEVDVYAGKQHFDHQPKNSYKPPLTVELSRGSYSQHTVGYK